MQLHLANLKIERFICSPIFPLELLNTNHPMLHHFVRLPPAPFHKALIHVFFKLYLVRFVTGFVSFRFSSTFLMRFAIRSVPFRRDAIGVPVVFINLRVGGGVTVCLLVFTQSPSFFFVFFSSRIRFLEWQRTSPSYRHVHAKHAPMR